MDTFFQQIIQVANTPFKIMGRAVGIEGKITRMEFDPVHAVITPDIGTTLDNLVKVLEAHPDLEVTLIQKYDLEEVTEDYAVYQVKSDYYKQTYQTREVIDYYSIDAVNTERREFRGYLREQSNMTVNSRESMIEACQKIKSETLEQDTQDLLVGWNNMIEQYLVENGISSQRFEFEPQQNEKNQFEYELTSDKANKKQLKKAVKEVR